jgi:hypothetical protein
VNREARRVIRSDLLQRKGGISVGLQIHATRVHEEQGGEMKKLMSLCVFALYVAAPSFGAEHLLSRSVKVVSKDSYRVVKTPVEDTGKATAAVVKFVF